MPEQPSPLIAVVDDDASIREALESLLKSVGLRVKAFVSAEDFLDAWPWGETACLILDVRMPGIDGLELQRQLAQLDASIPIIFITAHGSDEMRQQALANGALAFLSKPFSEDALLNAVQSALSKA